MDHPKEEKDGMYRSACSLLTAIVFLSLVHQPAEAGKPRPRLVSFDEFEYLRYEAEGTAAILGQAFIPTKDGRVIVAAGRKVSLVPVTNYSTEWWERAVLAGENIAPADSLALRYTRVTTADARGDFRFDGVPAGRYYLHCPVKWESTFELYGFSKVNVDQEAQLGAMVELKKNEEAKVLLEVQKKPKK